MNNYVPDQNSATGLYLQQTPTFDTQTIAETEVTSPQFKELIIRLQNQVNLISSAVNQKETGLNVLEEYRDAVNWFPTNTFTNVPPNQLDLRPEFRKVVNFGALPAIGPKSVPHNIPIANSTVGGINPYICVGIEGYATKQTTAGVGIRWLPLPYASNVANTNIEVYVTATHVVVTTAIDYSAYTECYFVLKYLKR